MRALLFTLISMSSTAFADPQVSIDLPRRMSAWGSASVKVVVRNITGKPIVPLAIEVTSDAGQLAVWGVDGTQVRWGFATPARHRNGAWEVLLGGPPPQQMASPPDVLSQDATEQLVQLDPIPAGETIELEEPFVAKYQHGGKLAVTMTYVVIDPSAVALCTATTPAQKAFVACKPISKLGGTLYAAHADLVKAQATVRAQAAFVVEHPKFDVADARAKAKVTSGDYGLERSTQKWILVDGARTVVVGSDGKLEELPGDWLEQLVSLDGTEKSTFWNASLADVKQIEKRLGADKLPFSQFVFKGHASPDRLMITFKRSEVGKLAAAMRALGYHMTRSGITKR